MFVLNALHYFSFKIISHDAHECYENEMSKFKLKEFCTLTLKFTIFLIYFEDCLDIKFILQAYFHVMQIKQIIMLPRIFSKCLLIK